MPKAKKKASGRKAKPSPPWKNPAALAVLALVIVGVAGELIWSSRKAGSGASGGGLSGSDCTLSVLSQIEREVPIQDMEVTAEGLLYAVDTQGVKLYKGGAVQARLELPWESMPSSSIGIGKTALFVNKTTAPELYRVDFALKGFEPITIEGAQSLYGIATDGLGKVYVSDQGKAVVYTLDEKGRLLGTLGGPELEKGGLSRPTDLCVDEHGDVFVIDQGQYQIIRFSAEGKVLDRWKTPWDKATVERIGVLRGKIYVNDHLGNGVFVMSLSGKNLGHCTKVQGDFALVAPAQLTAGKDGFLYVGSHQIAQVNP